VKEDTARTIAVVILRTPSLRRLAFGLARTAIVAGIPAWLSREIKQTWEESERPAAVQRAS
jgi:hypothetical protein